MISDEQRIAMLNKMSKILSVLPECSSIGEVSNATGIPTSTIQRYLNRKDLLEEVIGETLCEEFFPKIQEWLANAKMNGLINGGKVSQERHGYLKDEIGKFKENKR